MNKQNLIRLIISLAVPLAVGALGGLATAQAIGSWYASLTKPWLSPPNWVFAPVWTTLYLLMGLALYLVWKRGLDTPGVVAALVVFGIQLGLNLAWSFIFFGAHNIVLAAVEIVFLWIGILATIIQFSQISKTSAWLLLPYILWVSFAAYLNFAFLYLNQ